MPTPKQRAPPQSILAAKCRHKMHKTGNGLNYFPKSGQPKAKQGLQEIWMAETRAQAERAFDDWIERYQDKYPKATACLARDREQLLASDIIAPRFHNRRDFRPVTTGLPAPDIVRRHASAAVRQVR